MFCSLLSFVFLLGSETVTRAPQKPAPHQLSYAYALENGEIKGLNFDTPCIAMSTFKIYVALAVFNRIDDKKGDLLTKILIPKEDWEQETWSPLKKIHRGKDVYLTIHDLLRAMLVQSDNIATDALIAYLGGVSGLNLTLGAMGVPYLPFHATERQMQASREGASSNRLRPRDVIESLRLLREGKLLSRASTILFIELMYACETGKEKIRAQFPHFRVANRSGSSSRDEKGGMLADNDVGFVILPDGKCLYLAIYINHSTSSAKKHLSLIQKICRKALSL